jgi:anti-sigma factor (TIGR02949 family)
VQCAEMLRVQAYFDGEVDALAAAEIERHAGQCPQCHALLTDLEATRTSIRRELTHWEAPPQLRERITKRLDAEEAAAARPPALRALPRQGWRARPFWLGALGGALGAGLAASLAFVLLFPARPDALLDDLVAAHVRSLMPEHLTDVVSTDRHTVKPWFAGHADVSPAVADFAARGYSLIGGRADYLDHQHAAVTVYQHGAHLINVFSWVAGARTLPGSTSRDGYHVGCWKAGTLQYCAVSDAGWEELATLRQLLQDLAAHDARE